ncbi:Undecaprenyl-diphosphatase [Candidatus Tiddalikarchaeum anstoanum]|nr:Undecaprenyl-diphosphatase [Candidatus Tiddalikarchaeum anstoanum]
MLELIASGIIQGIAEWLPISSQGIISLILLNSGYSLQQSVDIAFFLHSGTLLAMIMYFWSDVKRVLNPKTGQDVHLLSFLIWSTLFSLITGLPFYFLIGSLEVFSNNGPKIIGTLLILMGVMHSSRKEIGSRNENSIGRFDGLTTGLLQGFSVLPGVSRSGVTTLALLLRGFNIDSALKYSFLAGIPVILGLQIVEFIKGFYFDPIYLLSAAAAFIVGRITIGYFFKIAKKLNFTVICIILGILSILL